MKILAYLLMIPSFLVSISGFGQNSTTQTGEKKYLQRALTIEPGIGIHTNFGTDILISNLIQWNPQKHLSFASHSSFNINNISQRDFEGVKTNKNYSINQKFGIGTTLYNKKSTHTFLLMGGVKFTEFNEAVMTPDNKEVAVNITSFSPDFGLMYALKKGTKKHFFSFRFYLPLYLYPLKGFDIDYLDGNINNIALEFGVGIKIK
jgi:hypothetical protein